MARPSSTVLRALAAVAVVVASAAGSSPLPARGEERGQGPFEAEEDFTRAFAAAKAQGALVLVDVWAPW